MLGGWVRPVVPGLRDGVFDSYGIFCSCVFFKLLDKKPLAVPLLTAVRSVSSPPQFTQSHSFELLYRSLSCSFSVDALKREIEVLKIILDVSSSTSRRGVLVKTQQKTCSECCGQSKLVIGNHTARHCHSLLMWCASGVSYLDSSSRWPEKMIVLSV